MLKVPIVCLVATMIVALIARPSLAQDAAAETFLKHVYAIYEKSDKGLDISSQSRAARYFVPALAKLIAQDLAQSAKRNEVGKLDFDPFIGGQDWAPTKIDLKVMAGATADHLTGTARFTPLGEKQATVVTLDLTKTAAGWRIADIHWAGQAESLMAIMRKKD